MKKVTENFRRDYEAEEYDVIVAGGGIAEELLRLSIRYGAEARYPDAWLEPLHRTGRMGAFPHDPGLPPESAE